LGLKNNKLAKESGDYYVEHSPLKTHLIPGTVEILEHLQQKYQLNLVTNGFEEVQWVKIKQSNLQKYFVEMITSERAGVKKPDPKIFEFALKLTKAQRQNSVMIGDDLVADIKGAKASGIYSIWFNREGKDSSKLHNVEADWEIKHLTELKSRF
jgi:putative hydrolase of the HAD superfamily